MRAGMAALAALCVGLGLFSPLAVALIWPAAAGLLPAATPPLAGGWSLRVVASSQFSPSLLALLLLLVAGIAVAAQRVFRASSLVRRGPIWGCGRVGQTARMQCTASAFAEPLRRVFAEVYQPTHDLSVEAHPQSKYFIQSIEYRTGIHPWFETTLYAPLAAFFRAAAARAHQVQAGSLHLYLAYIFVALLALLAAVKWIW
jgi:hydrogenase-4 component B